MIFSANFIWAQHRAEARASLEIGADSSERRYFRPRLRFDFPLGIGAIFVEMDYLQRINSDLRGEVDFWLSTGVFQTISRFFSVDAGIHHLCRHKTSRDYPVILDVNELFARVWYQRNHLSVGLGGGTYLGTSGGHDHILIFNIDFPGIFQSEFSISAQTKVIDWEYVLYDLELACGVSPSLDLFLRSTKHYHYPQTVYMGLRIKEENNQKNHLDKLRFKAGIYPFRSRYKVAGSHEFKLDFLDSSKSRLIILLEGHIPVFWEKGFIGPYRLEKIRYPLCLQYEKKLGSQLFAAWYFRTHISMPVDVEERFSSDLGTGLILRNQRDFDELKKRFRFEVFSGPNFSHTMDVGGRLGWNSVGERLDFGTDLKVVWKPEEWMGSVEFFIESGNEVKLRPYIGFQRTEVTRGSQISFSSFLFGVMIMRWY